MSEAPPEPPRWPGRLRWGTAWTTLWVLGIMGLIVIVNPSEPFKGCVHNNKNAAQYQELHEGNAGLVATVTRFYLRSRLIGICAANFADANERVIGALAAIALSIFTLYLWRATHGLRRYAGIQAGDMQKLLTAAQGNTAAAASQAEAMKNLHAAALAQERVLQKQADATTAVAKAAQSSADISRRALTELERPYVVVEVPEPGIQGDASGNFSFSGSHPRWEVSNYGRSPAILIDRITRWKVENDGTLPYVIDPSKEKGLSFPEGCLVSEGRPFSERHNYFMESDEFQKMLDDHAWQIYRIWFFGYLRYGDILGGIYINGFSLVFDHRGQRFVRIGPSTHNYTRVEKQPGT
jgi:hypothetical protein